MFDSTIVNLSIRLLNNVNYDKDEFILGSLYPKETKSDNPSFRKGNAFRRYLEGIFLHEYRDLDIFSMDIDCIRDEILPILNKEYIGEEKVSKRVLKRIFDRPVTLQFIPNEIKMKYENTLNEIVQEYLKNN